jgi:hypothetical protein
MFRGKGKPSAKLLICSKKSKTQTTQIYIISLLFSASLVALEFLFQATLLVRCLIAILLGILLYNIHVPSKPVKIFVLIMAGVLLLFPKITVTLEYPCAKSSADAWMHLASISGYIQIGRFEGVDYYTAFPIVYSHILFLSNIIGIDAYYASTIYYLIINLLTALVLYEVCEVLAKLEKWNAEKSLFPLIGVMVYSIVYYPNCSVLKELPQATGLLSMGLALYALLKMQNTYDHKFVVIGILVALLSLSHPFAPIFVTCFFASYKILKALSKNRSVIPTSFLVLLPLLLLLSYYSTLPSFKGVILWFKDSLMNSINVLLGTSTGPGPLERFSEVSMDVKYPSMFERLLYGLNWALPGSVALSFLLFLLVQIVKHRNIRILETPSIFLNTIVLTSVILFGFGFAFSPIEYSFSRYFGTYAVLISIPIIAYLVDIALKKSRIAKLVVISIILIATIAMLTDCAFLPSLQVNTYYKRERAAVSELTSTPELYAARFFALKLFQQYSIIYTDRNYVSTLNFFTNLHSSLKPNIKNFNYPATTQDLQLLIQTHNSHYVLIREIDVGYQIVNRIGSVLLYSNGETYEIFISAFAK